MRNKKFANGVASLGSDFEFYFYEIFFGTLRARAAGGVHTVSSNLNRSKFENALEPYGCRLGEVWEEGIHIIAYEAL